MTIEELKTLAEHAKETRAEARRLHGATLFSLSREDADLADLAAIQAREDFLLTISNPDVVLDLIDLLERALEAQPR